MGFGVARPPTHKNAGTRPTRAYPRPHRQARQRNGNAHACTHHPRVTHGCCVCIPPGCAMPSAMHRRHEYARMPRTRRPQCTQRTGQCHRARGACLPLRARVIGGCHRWARWCGRSTGHGACHWYGRPHGHGYTGHNTPAGLTVRTWRHHRPEVSVVNLVCPTLAMVALDLATPTVTVKYKQPSALPHCRGKPYVSGHCSSPFAYVACPGFVRTLDRMYRTDTARGSNTRTEVPGTCAA